MKSVFKAVIYVLYFFFPQVNIFQIFSISLSANAGERKRLSELQAGEWGSST